MQGIQINSRLLEDFHSDVSVTWEVQFAPQFVVAWVTLAKVDTPNGNVESGIVQFRRRLASGGDETVDLGGGPFYSTNAVSGDRMTSITFALWVTHGLGKAESVVSFW